MKNREPLELPGEHLEQLVVAVVLQENRNENLPVDHFAKISTVSRSFGLRLQDMVGTGLGVVSIC